MLSYFHGNSGAITAFGTGTKYNSLQNSGVACATTESYFYNIIPCNGVLTTLFFASSVTPSGSGTIIVTIRVNGADTAITCTVDSAGGGTASDSEHTVNVSAGDYVSMKIVVNNALPSSPRFTWVLGFSSTTAKQSIISGNTYSTTLSTSATRYLSPMGLATPSATENDYVQVIAVAGTIKNLYCLLSGTPGTGNDYAFTLMKNGEATTLTCSIADSATTGNDTTHAITVAAGDLITIRAVPTSGPTARYVAWGLCFEADIDGYYNLMTHTAAPSTSNNSYTSITGASLDSESTATEGTQFIAPTTFVALYIRAATAPGAGKEYAVYLSDSGTDYFFTTVAGVSQTASIEDYSFEGLAYIETGFVYTKLDPNATPSSNDYAISYGIRSDIITYGQDLVDSVTATDSQPNINMTRTISDSITNTDILRKSLTRILQLEGITCTDTLTKFRVLYRTLTETFSMSDTINRNISKRLTDSSTLTDTYTRAITLKRTLTDSVTETDNISKGNFKILNDSVVESDNINKRTGKLLIESITETDTIRKNITRLLSDAVTDSDTLNKYLSRIISDSVTETDIIRKGVGRTFNDSASIVDVYTRLWTAIRTYIETIAQNEIQDMDFKGNKNVSDLVYIADYISFIKQLKRTLTDNITESDTLNKSPSKTFNETISESDIIRKNNARILNDSVVESDNINKGTQRILTDSVTETDNINKNISKLLLELTTLQDYINRGIDLHLSENISPTDYLNKGYSVILSDLLNAVDDYSDLLKQIQALYNLKVRLGYSKMKVTRR